MHEWHKRVKLFEGKPREIINTYTEAVETVDPKIASGKPHTLWCEFAKFYEQNDQIEDVSSYEYTGYPETIKSTVQPMQMKSV